MISQTSSQWGSWSHDLAGKENGFPAHRKVRALSDSLYCKASRLCIEVTQSKQLYGVGMSQHSFESLDRRYQESLYFSFLAWTLLYEYFFLYQTLQKSVTNEKLWIPIDRCRRNLEQNIFVPSAFGKAQMSRGGGFLHPTSFKSPRPTFFNRP